MESSPRKKQEALDAFKARMNEFVTAGISLVTAWENVEVETEVPWFGDALIKEYPFDKDFYEILNDMYAWSASIRTLQVGGVLDWYPKE